MKLFSYFRSSAAYRVRIALALKGISYETVAVHLTRNGGEQHAPGYLALNPAGLVPTLTHEDSVLTQSLAIMEFLDELHPQPPLLPRDLAGRARVRAIALTIACDMHPLNNRRVLQYLSSTLGAGEEQKSAWYSHWVERGLSTLESMLAATGHSTRFCYGDFPTLADCCLVPQLYNARRFNCTLDQFPILLRIDDACSKLEAFRRAAPELQPDAAT